MGWNSWNHHQCNMDEKIVKATDDCWAERERDWKGNLVAKSLAFPSGIKELADYVHAKGLRLGIYSDAGYRTCSMTMPGSLGHEEQDARIFAHWGVDYLKFDNCHHDGSRPQERYAKMSYALLKAGRPILYSICEWGEENPATWASMVMLGEQQGTSGTNGRVSHRLQIKTMLGEDMQDLAGGMLMRVDPDMLEVGNGGMRLEESRSHFSIWALMKAPLLIGCDIQSVSRETLEILGNKEVIDVNQDPLAVQGRKIRSKTGLEIWAGPISKRRVVVVLWNRSNSLALLSFRWREIGLCSSTPVLFRELWAHSFVSMNKRYGLTANVAPHACKIYIVSPI